MPPSPSDLPWEQGPLGTAESSLAQSAQMISARVLAAVGREAMSAPGPCAHRATMRNFRKGLVSKPQGVFGQERGGEGGEGASRAHTCAHAAAHVQVDTHMSVHLCTCAVPGMACGGS